MQIPRLVIAGTQSGVGKTSVASGILRALTRAGVRTQPFKVGPDFIDPTWLSAAAGRPCRTLDSWMLPAPTVLELFARGSEGAQVSVIEGMMGLYDGEGRGDDGSTAEVSRLLGAPVILVIDVGGAARSAAATALGFAVFDPRLTIAGVIANRVGGAAHIDTLRSALESAQIPLLGAVPVDDRWQIGGRHLGLMQASEAPVESTLDAFADMVVSHVDMEALMRIARATGPVVVPGPLVFPPIAAAGSVPIGLARDEAFTFYYQDGLEMLEGFGAVLVPFSPIRDPGLPEIAGLYLGGGYPELHANALSANAPMRRAVAAAVRAGMPVYAECGGLLYLCRTLITSTGDDTSEFDMAGVLPAVARMQPRLAALSYVTLTAEDDTLLLRRGESVRAHEFHWSTIERDEPLTFAYRVTGGRGIEDGRDGIATESLLATYSHVHFAAKPEMAQRFVEACRNFQRTRR